jgi:triosephosphate isomerase
MIIAGNWKMNKTNADAKAFLREYGERVSVGHGRTVIFCVPATCLSVVSEECKKVGALAGGQNLHPAKSGAFTGEISADMLVEAGARYVLVGHSERRNLFDESDDFINLKVKTAVTAGLIPILCVGESLKEREAGVTFAVVEGQLRKGLDGVDMGAEVLLAYEPVWAIGTGLTATVGQIAEVHSFIKGFMKDTFGVSRPVLYGGSVNEKNCAEITSIPNVDGVLVGGASLDPAKFAEMVKLSSDK